MKALYLDKKEALSLRDDPVPQHLGANDVRIKIANVGVCGSDVHYYLHGRIGGAFTVAADYLVRSLEATIEATPP